MKLLNSTYIVTETTALGTTAGASSGSPAGVGFTLRKITAFGVSSVAANTSGGLKLNYSPNSSADTLSTLVILPSPTSVGLFVELTDLRIGCGWFDVATNEAGQYSVLVYGD